MKNFNKKYILGIESTGKIAGIALLCNDKIIDEVNIDNGLTHSVTLFTNLEMILNKNKVKIGDIEKIKVSNGPGSFTGIRIGISCALGLSINNKIPIEYVDTLKALAYNSKSRCDYIFSMIDAKCNRVYLSIYRSSDMQRVIIDKIVELDYLCTLLNKYFTNRNINIIFVGDAVINYKDKLINLLNINYKFADKNLLLPKASSVALTSGIISKVPLINYLQASKAEREKYGKN